MPIQNIPVMLMMWGVIAFSISMFRAAYKDEKHCKGIERVRRCEIHRRAMISRYHRLV